MDSARSDHGTLKRFGFWLLVCIVGWGIALVLNYLAGVVLNRSLVAGDRQFLEWRFATGALVMGAGMGLVVGLAQSIVLQRKYDSRQWVPFTVAGTGIGMALSYLWFSEKPTTLLIGDHNDALKFLMAVATIVFCVALPQAILVARRQLWSGMLWLGASVVVGSFGFLLGYSLIPLVFTAPPGSVMQLARANWLEWSAYVFLIGATVGGLLGLAQAVVLRTVQGGALQPAARERSGIPVN